MQIDAMIVDDSPFARKLIRRHLERLGCKVVGEAEDGRQALEMFRDLAPQLVTLDVIMPAPDSVDTLTVFRNMKHDNPDVAIILVSAIPFEHFRDTFLKEGAVDYIVKPFKRSSFDQLRLKLTRIFPQLARR